MTGLLLAFTGRAVTITNQYNTPYCVAHAVATCASVYGDNTPPQERVGRLKIGPQGFNTSALPQATHKHGLRIGKPRKYNKSQLIKLLNKGPIIADIGPKMVDVGYGTVDRHTVCAPGYDNNYIYLGNSRGTGRGNQGYGRIRWEDVDKLSWITIGSKNLTPGSVKIYASRPEPIKEKIITGKYKQHRRKGRDHSII